MKKLRDLLIEVLLALWDRLQSIPSFKRLFYDALNRKYFADLFEQEVMLADKVRVDAYYNAILKYVKEGDVVIDLGTGTGILSFFASSRKPMKIYALEHSDIIETAKVVANQNGMENIEFIKIHSKAFSISTKVDVILHEQIGDYLFDENMVENIIDLRDRLLDKNGKIIPSKFEMFIEPVGMADEYRVPFIWEQNLYNVRFDYLRNIDEKLRRKYSSYYYYKNVKPCEIDYLLCKPVKVFSLDLETVEEQDIPKTLNYRKTVIRDGRMDGLYLYFKVIFDDEIFFDTSPLSRNTSWRIWVFRVESREFKKGDVLEFNWVIDDIENIRTWNFSYQKI